MLLYFQIPEPDSSIQSVSIDRKGRHLAAVNNKVRFDNFDYPLKTFDRASKISSYISWRDYFNAGKLLHLEPNRR